MAETISEVATSSVPKAYPSLSWRGYPQEARQRLLAELTDTGYIFPQTEDDLPYDDDTPMETFRHYAQMSLLIMALKHYWRDRQDVYVAGNMFVYFSPDQTLRYDFRGPDFFAVTGVENRERKSWITWNEGKAPEVVIELLSESTAECDRVEKKLIYQDQLKVANYYYYHPFNYELAGFALRDEVYEELAIDEKGILPCPQLGLSLVTWQGRFMDMDATWLRWANQAGEMLLTPDEDGERKAELANRRAAQHLQRAEQAGQRAEQEKQRAEQAGQRAEQEAQRAEQETLRAEQAEQLLALYRAKFGDLK